MCLLLGRTGAALAALVVSAGTFLLIQFLAPLWVQTAGLDVWEMDHELEKLRIADQRNRDLQDESELLNSQIEACNAVAAALIDNQIVFAVALDEVQEITHTRRDFAETLRFTYPGVHTHRQRIARYTIGKVRSLLIDDPTRQTEAIERLEAEYQKLVCR